MGFQNIYYGQTPKFKPIFGFETQHKSQRGLSGAVDHIRRLPATLTSIALQAGAFPYQTPTESGCIKRIPKTIWIEPISPIVRRSARFPGLGALFSRRRRGASRPHRPSRHNRIHGDSDDPAVRKGPPEHLEPRHLGGSIRGRRAPEGPG